MRRRRHLRASALLAAALGLAACAAPPPAPAPAAVLPGSAAAPDGPADDGTVLIRPLPF